MKTPNRTVPYPVANYKDKTNSKVDHPDYYGGDSTYETINVIEAWNLDFCLGNAIKYISRAGKKNKEEEIQDLQKAIWYITRKINKLK